jgi:SAM-dependent methyltransferase
MSQQDRERWDVRYAPRQLVMGEDPKALVLELEPALPRSGRALEIASGEGQLVLWLARRGLRVTAVDISAVALGKLSARAAAEGLDGHVELIERDLDRGLPPLEPGFDLASCLDFYSPAVVAEARELLAPGGLLLVEVLLQTPGGASPHRAEPGEALGFATGLQLQFYREGMVQGRGVAQLLAQRPPAGTLPIG